MTTDKNWTNEHGRVSKNLRSALKKMLRCEFLAAFSQILSNAVTVSKEGANESRAVRLFCFALGWICIFPMYYHRTRLDAGQKDVLLRAMYGVDKRFRIHQFAWVLAPWHLDSLIDLAELTLARIQHSKPHERGLAYTAVAKVLLLSASSDLRRVQHLVAAASKCCEAILRGDEEYPKLQTIRILRDCGSILGDQAFTHGIFLADAITYLRRSLRLAQELGADSQLDEIKNLLAATEARQKSS